MFAMVEWYHQRGCRPQKCKTAANKDDRENKDMKKTKIVLPKIKKTLAIVDKALYNV